ncbi:HlyU family transcriptional regulator [Jiella sp. M17.18]|uniref:HlyU family transcriptional regulator n=1 Tax=Jiella sp. M17.18 TaxID=3234247 RepID=UPI0034DFF4FF
MSFLKKLFGGGTDSGGKGSEPQVAAEEFYKGYAVAATPMKEGAQFRLAARISKEIDGETKTHTMIRADVFQSKDEAANFAMQKARSLIDEQGDALFST